MKQQDSHTTSTSTTNDHNHTHPDLVPFSFIVPDTVQNVQFQRPLLVLFDSGSTTSWFNRKTLPTGVEATTVESITGSTMAGTFSSNQQVHLTNLVLPEFRHNQFIPDLPCRVFTAECRYDMILGRDALRRFGLELDFVNNRMTHNDVRLPMRPFPDHLQANLSVAEQLQLDDMDDYLLDDPSRCHNDENFAPALFSDNDTCPDSTASSDLPQQDVHPATILPSLYDKADVASVVQQCTHLTQEQRDKLHQVLSKYETLFDGKLKKYQGEQIHLEIDPSISPTRTRAYPIPHAHLKVFKDELDRLV